MNHRFDHDPARELGLASNAIMKRDRHFPYPLAGSPDIPRRFNLESVAVGANSVERQ